MTKDSHSLAEGILLTDAYQLTMAQLYYRNGLHEQEVQFDHFFRDYPNYGLHKAGYCINAGLEWLVDWMLQARFREEDIKFLRSQKTRDGEPLFQEDFLRWLSEHGHFEGLSVRAIEEGRVVHPNVPLTVVRGHLGMAQILESALLNHLNYQTLIATKASRIRASGRGQLMLEFGLRRGPGKGANAGTRAALIGGADLSSNVGISHLLGLTPAGTHAHSMVQLFIAMGGTELDAFRAYADLYPNDCVLLVDTINTLESGVPNAIKVFEELRKRGATPVGIRLDSGDLAFLSIQSAKMLDKAGFPDTIIVLSNNLDELVIWQIITQIQSEAPRYGVDPEKLVSRLVYGVGTRLITSKGQPSLGGVYKLVAVYEQGKWVPAIKISETPKKTPNPGNKRVWRIYDQRNRATADLIGLADEEPASKDEIVLRHSFEATQFRLLPRDEISEMESILVKILEDGRVVYPFPDLATLRERRKNDVDRLDEGVKRIINPHVYHVSLTEKLWSLKRDQVQAALEDRTDSLSVSLGLDLEPGTVE